MGSKEMEEWEELHRAMDAKERRYEVQRAARIAANKVLWAASRLQDSAVKEAADEVIVAKMTEPAEQHPAGQSLSLEDEMFRPNTYYSMPNPL